MRRTTDKDAKCLTPARKAIALALMLAFALSLPTAFAKDFTVENNSITLFNISGAFGNILALPTGAGKVGIGIATTPQQTLEIVGTLNATGRSFFNGSLWIRGVSYTFPGSGGSTDQVLSTSATGVLSWVDPTSFSNVSTLYGVNESNTSVQIPVAVAASSGALKLAIDQGTGAGWAESGGTTYLTTAANKVGIGTSAAQQTLEVVGTLNATGRAFFNGSLWIRGIAYTFPAADGSVNQLLTTSGAGVLTWGDALTNISVLYGANASATSQEIPIRADATSGALKIALSTTTAAGWNKAGAVVHTATSSDSVGIGTTAPQQTLEVVGTLNATGRIFLNGSTWIRGVAYTWPSADGSSGQFLQTNAAGVLSWAAVSGTNLSGGGATNRLVKWLNTTHLTNSIVTDDGTNIIVAGGVNASTFINASQLQIANNLLFTTGGNLGVGTNNPGEKLHVVGNANVTGTVYSDGRNITSSVKVEIFTSNATWNKSAGAKAVEVILVSGGGGGGSGRRGAAGTSRASGAGGGGGAWAKQSFSASIIGASENVTIGGSGTGGAAVTVDSTNGANGTAGGASSFGSWLRATGGGTGTAGIETTEQSPVPSGGSGVSGGGNGAISNAASTVGGSSFLGGGGGGDGGGITSGDVYATVSLGPGGANTAGNRTGGTEGTNGSAGGGAGVNATANDASGGSGGGGGGANTGGGAFAGGNGGNYGGGGGGGGASPNGSNSGAGGNGAAGIVVVITYF